MKSVTLAEFLALNEQLAAFNAAGIPLAGELWPAGSEPRQSLLSINAGVQQRIDEGLTLSQAIDAEPQLTAAYRSLLQAAIQGEGSVAAIAGPQHLAHSDERLAYSLRAALLYPLILLATAYVGLILGCLFLVPTLENLYAELHLPLGSGLRVLQALRVWLPYWVGFPPFLVALALLLDRRSSRLSRLAWLPGTKRVWFEQECSQFASTLAKLLSTGTTFNEALPIAAMVWRDATLARDAGLRNAEQLLAARLPPFLRWALWQSGPTMPRAEALQLAAKLYYESSERRCARLRIILPLAIGIFAGGGVTLLYGLALFVPFAELLHSVSTTPNVGS